MAGGKTSVLDAANGGVVNGEVSVRSGLWLDGILTLCEHCCCRALFCNSLNRTSHMITFCCLTCHSQRYAPTVMDDMMLDIRLQDGTVVVLHAWDTAGQQL
jgi:hypothetical protein